MILGIVGGIGAGKSTVVQIMKELANIFVIDVDKIGHAILAKDALAYNEIIEEFGDKILDDEKNIIRKILGEIVFNDPIKLLKLNQISHPKIYMEVERILKSIDMKKYKYIVIDCALLFEIGLDHLVDKIIGVYASEQVRAARIMKRNNISYENALVRIRKQKSWQELQSRINYFINNDGNDENLQKNIKDILEVIL
ncbi:dephospho-CoA kinase [Candidatus Epulonipiscioides gigas]|nr:dephospho-CoA kinase [Epulopiscium sp. SCG-C07WGA-EpuloA2]